MQEKSLDKMARAELLTHVQECRFMMTDLALYLDTHPTDADALDLYREHAAMYQAYADAYAARFGALSQCQVTENDGWAAWSNTPWPWEKEANPNV